MTLPDIVFCVIAGIILIGAWMAVWLRNVFYNALSLIFCFFGVACLFIYLNSEFLAVMQVIIYIGAISVAIIFAIMLSRPMFHTEAPRKGLKVFGAFLISTLLFIGLTKTIHYTNWPAASIEGDYSIAAIGKALLTHQVLPFETVSLVLLVAIIGALLLSNRKGSS